jgi:hypothetical protein
MPPIMWCQSFVLAAAGGATVFKFGGESSVTEWGGYDRETDRFDFAERWGHEHYTALWDMQGHPTRVLDRYVVPFMRPMVRQGLIPTRDQVLSTTKLAVRAESPTVDKGDAAWYGRYAPLYLGTYGIRDYVRPDPSANAPFVSWAYEAPVTARYVRIELFARTEPRFRERVLSLAEVKVFARGQNVARQGAATQSTEAWGGVPALAIDGIVDGRYDMGSVTHTGKEDNPWWELDLGADKPVDRLEIYNRRDIPYRLHYARVSLLNADREELWKGEIEPPEPRPEPDGNLYELIANTGRYHVIPILPYGVDAPPMATVAAEALTDAATVRRRFNTAYPAFYEGDAWVARVADSIFVMNTHENRDVAETFSIPIGEGNIERLSGQAIPHWYLVAKLLDGGAGLWLQANANHKGPYTDGRSTSLQVACGRRPEVVAEPSAALRRCEWDDGILRLELSHETGAVDVDIR